MVDGSGQFEPTINIVVTYGALQVFILYCIYIIFRFLHRTIVAVKIIKSIYHKNWAIKEGETYDAASRDCWIGNMKNDVKD